MIQLDVSPWDEFSKLWQSCIVSCTSRKRIYMSNLEVNVVQPWQTLKVIETCLSASSSAVAACCEFWISTSKSGRRKFCFPAGSVEVEAPERSPKLDSRKPRWTRTAWCLQSLNEWRSKSRQLAHLRGRSCSALLAFSACGSASDRWGKRTREWGLKAEKLKSWSSWWCKLTWMDFLMLSETVRR